MTKFQYYIKIYLHYDPEICRFITIDDISYLNPDVINGVNLYAYCGNNPIMYYDPTGNIGIILGAILFGALFGFIGSTATVVVKDLENGQLFDGDVGVNEYLGNILTGTLLGAATGAALGLGAAIGAAASTAGIVVTAKTAVLGLASVTAGSFAVGLGTYAIDKTLIENGQFNETEFFTAGIKQAIKGAYSFSAGL